MWKNDIGRYWILVDIKVKYGRNIVDIWPTAEIWKMILVDIGYWWILN